MSYSHEVSQSSAEQDFAAQHIRNVAYQQGVVLSEERLEVLVEQVEEIRERRAGGKPVCFQDRAAGFRVYPMKERDGRTYAQVDFTPKTRLKPGGAIEAQPQERTPLLAGVIRALQDYAFLVEAGYLDRPDYLYGVTLSTNREMIKTAERFGFVVTPPGTGWLQVAFDSMTERAFSPEIRRLEAILARRMTSIEADARIPRLTGTIGFLCSEF